MIRYGSSKQLLLDGFKTPFEVQLDSNNRWVKFSTLIPWDDLGQVYAAQFSTTGRPAKPPQLVIGALIIKHKLCLSDEETVRQIQENPYLQYFVGLPGYTTQQPFAPSLFVEIRRRMGDGIFQGFEQAVIDAMETLKTDNNGSNDDNNDSNNDSNSNSNSNSNNDSNNDSQTTTPSKGTLILDASLAPQQIRFPTDLSLLNEAREISERLIDELYPHSSLKKKPRTYRQRARKDYLAIVKQKRPKAANRRKAIRKQLNYLRRNLKSIDQLIELTGIGYLQLQMTGTQWLTLSSLISLPRHLSAKQFRQLRVIHTLYDQQQAMFDNKSNRCDDRIVSIHQPHVRPIVRGKPHVKAEFGAKINVSLNPHGIACLDALRWDAFHEGNDLEMQVEQYRERYGHYPNKVLADPIYGTRQNRRYLKANGINFGGKPLGRPPKPTEDNKELLKQKKQQQTKDYRQRIPIEGKFGQGKNGYGLNLIKAMTKATSEAWIRAIFFVMNLFALQKEHHFLISITQLAIVFGHFLSSIHLNLAKTILGELCPKLRMNCEAVFE